MEALYSNKSRKLHRFIIRKSTSFACLTRKGSFYSKDLLFHFTLNLKNTVFKLARPDKNELDE